MRITLIFFISSFLFSQDVRLSNVNSENYPLIQAKIVVMDEEGNQITDFDNNQIIIIENGQQLEILEIGCQGEPELQKVSAVLSIDVSRSMDGDGINLARAAANEWVNQMLPDSETAITAFSDISYLLTDFTKDKTVLSDIIQNLFLIGGTNFDEAFLDEFAGALTVSENAQNRPIVVFLTDGLAEGNTNKIIQKAAEVGALIYSVILFEEATDVIRDITESSGGLVFDQVDNIPQIQKIYQTIFNLSQSQVPCTLTWETVGCQLERTVTANFGNASNTISYTSRIEDLARIVYPNGQFLIFDDSELGDQDKRDILIKAEIEDLLIENIIIENPKFSLINYSPEDFPIVLKKDSSKALRIQFDHTEDKFESTNILIESNACRGNVFYATGGVAGSLPGANNIKLIEPNGGEIYATGADTLIKWEGSFPNEKLEIEYTIDNGNTWVSVNGNINDETLKVEYPNSETDNGRVRITQFSSDFGTEYLVSKTKGNILNSVDWNPNGGQIIVSYNDGSISNINSLNGEINNSKTIHTGNANTARWSPDGIRFATAGDDGKLVITNQLNLFELFSFDVSDEPLLTVDWSPDGRMLATAGLDKNIYLWDPDNGTLINSFEAHNKKINKLKFSHDGSMIVSVSSDSLAKVWRVADWQRIDGMTRINAEITGVDWLKNDAQIVTTTNKSGQNELNMWDIFIGAPLNEVEHLEYFNVIEVNDIEDLFVIGGRTGKPHLYGTDDFQREINFDLTNSSEISDVSWSPSGDRFAIATKGSPDSTSLKFYSIKEYPIAVTESQANFSLRRSTARLKTIDFGQTNINTTKELTIDDLIELTGPVELRIDSIFIENDFSNVFSLRGETKFTLSQTENKTFVFDFTPKQIRDYSANIVIISSLGERRGRILGEGINPSISNIEFDFGEIIVGKEDTKEFWVVNNSNQAINIDNVNILGPNFTEYNLVRPENLDQPRVINPNDSLQFIIRFSPDKIGRSNSIIQINYQESDVAAFLTSKGIGVKPEVSVSSASYYSIACYVDGLLEFQIENTGNGNLEVSNIIADNQNVDIINSTIELRENQSESITFTLPFLEDNQTLNFEIQTNDPENPIIQETITVDMLKSEFELSQNSITFLQDEENKIETKSVSIVNIGEAPIIWASDFTVTLAPDDKLSTSFMGSNPQEINENSSLSFTFNGAGYGDAGSNSFTVEDICGNSQIIEIFWEVESNSNLISIDFETIDLVCELETVFDLRLRNLSNRSLQIDNISFSDPNFTASGLSVLPEEGAELEVEFLTNQPGVYTTNISIEYNNQVYIKQITINVLERDYRFLTNSSTIILNTNGYDNAFVELINIGDVDLDLPIGQTFGNLTLVSSDQNPLPPGGQAMLEFGNLSKLISEDTVMFDIDCFENFDTLLISSVARYLPSLNVKIPVITRNIGERFQFPIEFEKINFDEELESQFFEFKLLYNSTLMLPGQTSNETIQNGSATFNLGSFSLAQNLTTPEFTVLWGNDSTTTLELNITGFDYPINYQNGLLRVADLCFEGGARLFEENGVNVDLSPNPVISSFNITFDKVPLEHAEINLINLTSGAKSNLFSGEVNSESLRIDLSSYSTGVYVIKVSVGESSMSKKIIIEN